MKTALKFSAILLAIGLFIPHSVVAQIPISYELPDDGRISLAVYDSQGRQVRTLLSGDKQEKGKHDTTWDGLDWTGRAAPAGKYQWRLLQSQGLRSEFLMRIGTSFNFQDWPGNHGGPNQVAVAGDIAILGGGGEFTPHMGLVNIADGKFVGQMSHTINVVDISAANNRLYMLGGEGEDHRAYLNIYSLPDLKSAGAKKFEVPVRKINFGEKSQPKNDSGWETTGLDLYDKDRGSGWDKIDDLAVGSGSDGKNPISFQGAKPIDPKADPKTIPKAGEKTLRTFIIDLPNGHYTGRVQLGDFTNSSTTLMHPGLKDGQPASPRRETVTPKGMTLRFDVDVTNGQLKLGFNSLERAPWVWAVRAVEIVAQPTRVSANASTVAIAYGNGRIEWLSPDEKMDSLGITAIEGARDIAVTDEGSVLAVAGNQIIEVSRADPKPATRIADLNGPKRISVDESNGDMLIVNDNGGGQIKRFSKDFKFIRAYGRAGGRQQGIYNPNDFCTVSDIAADGHGGFVISEDWSAPRRMAHFNPEGEMTREWYGGQLFFTLGSADPADPTRVWLNSHWGWIMEAEVDYEKRTWKPRTTYCFSPMAEGLCRSGTLTTWEIRRHGNQRYLVQPGNMPTVVWVDEEHRKLVPIVCSEAHVGTSPSPTLNALLAEANAKQPRDKKFSSYLWQDANGDGMPQKEEIALSGWSSWSGRWDVDQDLNFSCWELSPGDPKKFILRRMNVKSWEGNRPVYSTIDEAPTTQMPLDPELAHAKRDWGANAIECAPDGSIYQITKGSGEGYIATYWESPAHARLWPNNMSGSMGFCKWSSADGGLQWHVGALSTSGRKFQPGRMDDPTKVLGRVHGCVLLASRIVMPLQAWTEDGLFAGAMFDHRTEDGLPPAYYTWWRGIGPDGQDNMDSPIGYDMIVGGTFHELPNGDLLYYGIGWNNVPVYRVSGWDGFKRQSGDITIEKPASSAAGTGTGLSAEYFTSADLTGAPALSRIDPQLWFGDDSRDKKPWPDATICSNTFSARWTGFVEPRFSESYVLKAYFGTGRQDGKGVVEMTAPLNQVRVWLDGKLIIDGWNRNSKDGNQIWSDPIPLQAAQKLPIKIEYAKSSAGILHLCWESATQEVEHIPANFLYPQK